jgi:nitroreductase
LFESVSQVVRDRQTRKVLADPSSPLMLSESAAERGDRQLVESLQVAGMAPFHYDRGVDSLAEPWRAYVMSHGCCREVARALPTWLEETDQSPGKLPAMLAACGATVLVTWLPQFRGIDDPKPEQIDVDDEHLAAASAMVQNLLLLLTARGVGTYWSSGGGFKQPAIKQRLGIPTSEKLLAAVFVEYPETMSIDVERKPGKHRESRSAKWIRPVRLLEREDEGT